MTSAAIEILDGGLHTTVQDAQGRSGYWHVGVPPSGAMDDLSFRLANRAVGNRQNAAGLESVATGVTLAARGDLTVCVSGATATVSLDGRPAAMWEPVTVREGQILHVARLTGAGLRTYVAVRGGLDTPVVLGSRATFVLGGIGGHHGRPLRAGDVVAVGTDIDPTVVPSAVPPAVRPVIGREWLLGVLEGPHSAPEFVRGEWMAGMYGSWFTVDANSSRTGVRLCGPPPVWARTDGGDAGLHPSNIHDTGYAVGALILGGDTPVLLGPDGPSLGGFVSPVVVATAERWKVGQLAPGDRVRLVPISAEQAARLDADRRHVARTLTHPRPHRPVTPRRTADRVILHQGALTTHRRAGDRFLLVEVGPMHLDLTLRACVHVLQTWLHDHPVPGIVDVTPAVRSLLVQVDGRLCSVERISSHLAQAEEACLHLDDLTVPSRVVHLPLSWDDPAVRETIARYERSVRADAPWCPSNIEFIRRINGLTDVDEVRRIVFSAEYLVLGLGDVYLGAPVATPLDPRHRLVTTKYNPARTWTPPNVVGIGGAYLCVYGVEGPGGYQLVGRTVPIWSLDGGPGYAEGRPWLLRSFDRLVFEPVGADELTELRAAARAGRWGPRIENGTLSFAEHRRFLDTHAAEIAAFEARRREAFRAERRAWEARGELAGVRG